MSRCRAWQSAIFFARLLPVGLLLATGEAAATHPFMDVTARLEITRSGLVLNRSTDTFDSRVVVKNKGEQEINGPLRLLVTTSSNSVTLANLSGSTVTGTAYVDAQIAGGTLGPGQSLSATLKFSNPVRASFTYGVQVLGVPPGPVALPGLSGSLAMNATYPLDVAGPYSEDQLSTDAFGNVTIRTRLIILLTDNATVGDVNALLSLLGGRIVWMRSRDGILDVLIPDPGSISALDALLGQIGSFVGVKAALPQTIDAPEVLPDNLRLSWPNGSAKVRHHLAAKAHAAWNARSALNSLDNTCTPIFVIADWFNGRPPFLGIGGLGGAWAWADPGTCKPEPSPQVASDRTAYCSKHGYHVSGIAAATFGGVSIWSQSQTLLTDVTGMYPGMYSKGVILDLAVKDEKGRGNAKRIFDLLAQVVANNPTCITNSSIEHQPLILMELFRLILTATEKQI